MKQERLAEFESGERQPSLPQLRNMAKVYGRPLAVLLLDEPPQGWDAMRDFRRLPGAAPGEWSPSLHKAFRRALAQQEVVAELLGTDDLAARAQPFPGAEPLMDPEPVAADVRGILGVSLADQFRWGRRDINAPLRGWSAAVEEQGVLVLQAQHRRRGPR